MRPELSPQPQSENEFQPPLPGEIVSDIAYDFSTGQRIAKEQLTKIEQVISEFTPDVQAALHDYVATRNRALYNSIFTSDPNSRAVTIELDKLRNAAHNKTAQMLTESLPQRFPAKKDAYHYIQDLVGDGVDYDTAKEKREYERYS
ncbi:TPA: hypothetical protein DHW58_01610 [Patescibacteria group bacterium]|uniref:Uncharacterized protein n=2 Tax=Bacteria division Kazan-3B-28 TaxID=1798534 RepID=A0A0G1X7D2_UNCK3|nr:MAG: hypothetical protein VE98_C0001G0133 [candidate division Kazan bacterium GW2011_GWA1_50_15]KKW25591.1 MAG: hypothetical protein VE99_C0001G0228 [candidate division Kazan bacterium GW2011_GWC1_52_13]KKW26896.1 MAG: hypothetical protein VF00_C0002G0221 [candidate division Kazan bacterium GW2011_GWB1_52_7]HAV66112.1 hypothetical protein [Patescibacteria group bacterium]HCL47666.1 hypothetical protein [Patescibacteria group bacterium]